MARTLTVPEQLAASDSTMAELVERYGELSLATRRRSRRIPNDAFGFLVRTVIGQQLSAKVAPRIHERVLALFDDRSPTPEELNSTDPETLRGAGLSGRKVEYLLGLAEAVTGGELDPDALDELSDEEIGARITALRGFGPWSADIFLMFHLERPDVLPVGDFGIRKAVQLAYRLAEPPDAAELTRIAEPWRPHRTLACIYLWESLHNAPLPASG